jgi:opacity protein-like surface antigen
MMKMMRLCIGLCLLLSAASFVSAQPFEASVSGGATRISSRDIGSGYGLDDGITIGFRMTLNTYKFFGHEGGYSYNRTHLLLDGVDQGGMAVHTGFYNFMVYGTPEGSRIRPFVGAGPHFANFVPPGQSAQYGQGNTKFGINYGGGVKVKVTSLFHVRFDVHQYLQGKPFDLPGSSGKLKLNTFSVGIGIGI